MRLVEIIREVALTLYHAPTLLLAQNPLSSASGVYDSSQTPPTLPWNTYNFCNAPHVNAAHYDLPPQALSSDGAQLIHVSVVMRHHKVSRPVTELTPNSIPITTPLQQRTPDNLAPSERALNPPMGWDCSGVEQLTYDLGGAAIAHEATTPPQHPFARKIWPGTCDAGQLTAGGLLDASQHGRVSRSPHPFLLTVAEAQK
jgi:2-phosphoxylose phosphatase